LECDPYCIVTIGEQKQKTKTIKKSLNPRWNVNLPFSARGINKANDIIKIVIKDANHKGFDMGRLEISLIEFCATGETEQWFRLSNESGEDLASSICLLFEIRGHGKEICPLCGIFIGDESCVCLYSEIIHSSCLVCNECGKSVPDLIYHNGRYYDNVCYERRYGLEAVNNIKTGLSHNWTNIPLYYSNLCCSYCGLSLGREVSSCQECAYTCHPDCQLKCQMTCLSLSEETVQLSKITTVPIFPRKVGSKKLKK